MKFPFIAVVLFLVLQTNVYSQTSFYNHLFCNLSMGSAYIVVNVESPDYTGKAVILNESLFGYFIKKQGFNGKQYLNYLRKALTDGTKIQLQESDFHKWYFDKLKTIEAVEKIAQEGREKFLGHYFEANQSIKKNLSKDEKNAVIAKLFEWKILTFVDDESGILGYVIPDAKTAPEYPECSEN
jgi:hypothetical protein